LLSTQLSTTCTTILEHFAQDYLVRWRNGVLDGARHVRLSAPTHLVLFVEECAWYCFGRQQSCLTWGVVNMLCAVARSWTSHLTRPYLAWSVLTSQLVVNNVYDDATDHAAAAAVSLAAWTSDANDNSVNDSSASDSSFDQVAAVRHRNCTQAKPAPLSAISVPALESVAVNRLEAERACFSAAHVMLFRT
jgi:hypothetical protein